MAELQSTESLALVRGEEEVVGGQVEEYESHHASVEGEDDGGEPMDAQSQHEEMEGDAGEGVEEGASEGKRVKVG
jgi:hypothetical protein